MKRRFLVGLWAVLLFPPTAWAEVRILKDTSQEILLEVTSPKPELRAVSRRGRAYTEVRMEEFDHDAAEGAPQVPHLIVRLLVPEGAHFETQVLDRARERGVRLPSDVAFAERRPVHDGHVHLAVRDERAYGRIHGERLVEVLEEGRTGSDRILVLRLWPLRYEPRSRGLTHTPHFRVKIAFQPLRPGVPLRLLTAGGVANSVVLNPRVAVGRDSNRKRDLIIADERYRMDLFRLVEFKRSHGRTVKEYYVAGKTAKEIKEIILAEHKSAEPPTQTILVGNVGQIPAFKGSGDNSWTDYDYQITDSDSIPDIALGRIPASDGAELRRFIEKFISRELDPRDVNQVLLTAGKDTSLGCPANVTKVGNKVSSAGTHIQLTKKFKTEVGTSDVIAAYNANPNLVVYDGHGNRSGMTEVPLLMTTLNQLTNTVFPLVLDIACLNANWSSSAGWRNFTEANLFLEGRGAAGLMASGGSGNGHEFFQSLGQIMADAKKKLSSDTLMNEIGQVILAAKIKHGQQDRSYWNYYGDPSSSVWESSYTPEP